MSVKIFIVKILDATAESPNNSLRICSKFYTASCCVLISKDALPDFVREFVRVVKKNDGATQDFEVSNFAMTRQNEEAKGEVVCKAVEESDQKADVTLIKETTVKVLSQFLNCICSRYLMESWLQKQFW